MKGNRRVNENISFHDLMLGERMKIKKGWAEGFHVVGLHNSQLCGNSLHSTCGMHEPTAIKSMGTIMTDPNHPTGSHPVPHK